MSQEENDGGRRSYSYFRMSLDMGMGFVYLILAGWVVYSRHFGTIELGTGTVYGLAGLLVLYGGFRIYRALVSFRNDSRES